MSVGGEGEEKNQAVCYGRDFKTTVFKSKEQRQVGSDFVALNLVFSSLIDLRKDYIAFGCLFFYQLYISLSEVCNIMTRAVIKVARSFLVRCFANCEGKPR